MNLINNFGYGGRLSSFEDIHNKNSGVFDVSTPVNNFINEDILELMLSRVPLLDNLKNGRLSLLEKSSITEKTIDNLLILLEDVNYEFNTGNLNNKLTLLRERVSTNAELSKLIETAKTLVKAIYDSTSRRYKSVPFTATKYIDETDTSLSFILLNATNCDLQLVLCRHTENGVHNDMWNIVMNDTIAFILALLRDKIEAKIEQGKTELKPYLLSVGNLKGLIKYMNNSKLSADIKRSKLNIDKNDFVKKSDYLLDKTNRSGSDIITDTWYSDIKRIRLSGDHGSINFKFPVHGYYGVKNSITDSTSVDNLNNDQNTLVTNDDENKTLDGNTVDLVYTKGQKIDLRFNNLGMHRFRSNTETLNLHETMTRDVFNKKSEPMLSKVLDLHNRFNTHDIFIGDGNDMDKFKFDYTRGYNTNYQHIISLKNNVPVNNEFSFIIPKAINVYFEEPVLLDINITFKDKRINVDGEDFFRNFNPKNIHEDTMVKMKVDTFNILVPYETNNHDIFGTTVMNRNPDYTTPTQYLQKLLADEDNRLSISSYGDPILGVDRVMLSIPGEERHSGEEYPETIPFHLPKVIVQITKGEHMTNPRDNVLCEIKVKCVKEFKDRDCEITIEMIGGSDNVQIV